MRGGFFIGMMCAWLAIAVRAQETSAYEAVSLDQQLDAVPQEAFVEPSPTSSEARASEEVTVEAAESVPTRRATGVGEPLPEIDRTSIRRATLFDSVSHLMEEGFSLFGPPAPGSRDSAELTAGVRVGYDDNVFTTHIDPQGSGFGSVFGTLAYNFGTERLKIDLALSGGVTYFDNRASDPTDYNGGGSLRIEYRATRRLTMNAMASVQYLSQPDPTLIGNVLRFAGDYTVANVGFDVSYAIRPRWSLTAGYQFASVTYADEVINQSLGFYDQNFSLSLAYLVSPRASLIVEYRYNPLLYYEVDEGSDGHLLLVGFDYSISPKALWTLRGGAEARSVREPIETAESSYLGPFVESQFIYNYAPNSNVALNLRYGTEPSGVSSIAIRQTFRAWASIDHAFTGSLSGTAAIYWQNDHYDLPGDVNDFAQSTLTGTLGLRYRLGPSFAIFGRYEYSAVSSDFETNEYTRNVTSLGVELIF